MLLRRYGVVFRRLLTREPHWLPPWHVLLRVYRRLEAQGQIRGGRFVAGISGEQYALPDAVAALRAVRKQPQRRRAGLVCSAADPLNLLGIVTPGARLAALAGNRFLLRDGVPVAIHAAVRRSFWKRSRGRAVAASHCAAGPSKAACHGPGKRLQLESVVR